MAAPFQPTPEHLRERGELGVAPERCSGAALAGKTVALLENRHGQQLAALVARRGGRPRLVPSLREVEVINPMELRSLLDELARAPLDAAIFQTGVGSAALLRQTAALGAEAAATLRQSLMDATIIARGPKPAAVLGAAGLRVDRLVPAPYTTRELLGVLDELALCGRRVLVQHHGGTNAPLVDALERRGAHRLEIVLYRWALPEDTAPLLALVDDLQLGAIDALLVTSAAQVHHLFAVAEQGGRAKELRRGLIRGPVIGAVGPVCAETLAEYGIPPERIIQPAIPKMVPLVEALVAYFQTRTAVGASTPHLASEPGADENVHKRLT